MMGQSMQCPTCGGKGWYWDAHPTKPAPAKTKDACPDCGGNGILYESEIEQMTHLFWNTY